LRKKAEKEEREEEIDKKAKDESRWHGMKKGWDTHTPLSLYVTWGNPTAHKDLIGHKNLWLTKFPLCWSGIPFQPC